MGKAEAKSRSQEFFPPAYLKQSVKILKLLSEESRLRLMLYLAKEGPCTVTEMVDALDLVQSTCSHHLSLLRQAGMVATARHGKSVYYDINELMWKQMGMQFFKYLQKGPQIDFLGNFALKMIGRGVLPAAILSAKKPLDNGRFVCYDWRTFLRHNEKFIRK